MTYNILSGQMWPSLGFRGFWPWKSWKPAQRNPKEPKRSPKKSTQIENHRGPSVETTTTHYTSFLLTEKRIQSINDCLLNAEKSIMFQEFVEKHEGICDVVLFFGLFLWKICLNNRFKSSGELF